MRLQCGGRLWGRRRAQWRERGGLQGERGGERERGERREVKRERVEVKEVIEEREREIESDDDSERVQFYREEKAKIFQFCRVYFLFYIFQIRSCRKYLQIIKYIYKY